MTVQAMQAWPTSQLLLYIDGYSTVGVTLSTTMTHPQRSIPWHIYIDSLMLLHDYARLVYSSVFLVLFYFLLPDLGTGAHACNAS